MPEKLKITRLAQKRTTIGSILDETGPALVKTSSLTRLNDVLGKTLFQEAKRNARSNEFVLSSERAEFKAQSL